MSRDDSMAGGNGDERRVLATPVTYLIVNKLKRAEGVDVYDRDTNFNPFARNREQGARV